jgi:hypothetical protein
MDQLNEGPSARVARDDHVAAVGLGPPVVDEVPEEERRLAQRVSFAAISLAVRIRRSFPPTSNTKIAATPAAPYSLASVTKVFTGTALALLADEGRIDVNRSVNTSLGPYTVRPALWDEHAITSNASVCAAVIIHIVIYTQVRTCGPLPWCCSQ